MKEERENTARLNQLTVQYSWRCHQESGTSSSRSVAHQSHAGWITAEFGNILLEPVKRYIVCGRDVQFTKKGNMKY